MSNNVVKYSELTPHYFLPVFRPDYGDGGEFPKISARAEQRRFNICDNIMRGTARIFLGKAFDTCVMNEGTWTVSGTTVTLSSFDGYIQSIYVANKDDPVVWSGIPTGAPQDLFVGLIETSQDAPNQSVFLSSREYGDIQVKIVASSLNYSNTNFMKMAQVTL